MKKIETSKPNGHHEDDLLSTYIHKFHFQYNSILLIYRQT